MYYFYFFQKNTHTPNLEFSSENNQKNLSNWLSVTENMVKK